MIDRKFLALAVKENFTTDAFSIRHKDGEMTIIWDDGREEPLLAKIKTRAEQLAAAIPPKVWQNAMLFKQEFTFQERAAMRNLAKTDPVAEDFLDMLNATGTVQADDPFIANGLDYFVTKKVITQERKDKVLKG